VSAPQRIELDEGIAQSLASGLRDRGDLHHVGPIDAA